MSILVLSLDIVIDKVSGDLQSMRTIHMWEEQAAKGLVEAVIGGHPCQSWCAAKWLVDDGPDPVRSVDYPWGLPQLSYRDMQLAYLGKSLRRTAYRLVVTTSAYRGWGLIEHPQPAPWELRHICSFRTQEVIQILQLPSAQYVEFDQCVMGQIEQKPTSAAIFSCPALYKAFLQFQNATKGEGMHPLGGAPYQENIKRIAPGFTHQLCAS